MVELMGAGLIKKLRKMNKAQRRAWWKKIPKWKKALYAMTLGPALLALVGAAAPVVLPKVKLIAAARLAKKLRMRAALKKRQGIKLTPTEAEALTMPPEVLTAASTGQVFSSTPGGQLTAPAPAQAQAPTSYIEEQAPDEFTDEAPPEESAEGEEESEI